ncbi:MAG: glycan-binding surface protein [Paludibacteraceae bacterium]|nr:glycan-binding surface protein [Paludibacteraceae bacterium]
MKMNRFFLASLALAAGFASCSNGGSGSSIPEMKRMHCEFVPDGEEAIIYGSNLKKAEIIFPGAENPAKVVSSCDTMIKVIVPEGSEDGQLKIKCGDKVVLSKFFFRDNRNIIVNFDHRLATWGGYNPKDEDGELITGTLEMGTEITPFANGAKLPESCSGNYGLLYGKYNTPWMMNQCMYIQYVANPMEGGRGRISVASKAFESYDMSSLALKFEVFVPKECAYSGIKTEIFFGPIDSPDKHGRDVSPICFWEPYKNGGAFSTDSWTTVTIPLSEFYHNTKTDTDTFDVDFDLKKATNLSFLQFGQPEGEPQIMMCVDNFRVVPIE